jgi:cytochrome c-type biogenesis protein CcmH/NrfF
MTRRRGILAALTVAGLLLGASAPLASAADDPWSFELWNELMSPYCPGRTLSDCPSGKAEELRGWIQDQEREGRSKEEVSEQLFVRFGDVILQAPRARGIGLVAYVIPVLAFLIGGAFVYVFLRRQGRGAAVTVPSAATAEAPTDPELERLVDEELDLSER